MVSTACHPSVFALDPQTSAHVLERMYVESREFPKWKGGTRGAQVVLTGLALPQRHVQIQPVESPSH